MPISTFLYTPIIVPLDYFREICYAQFCIFILKGVKKCTQPQS